MERIGGAKRDRTANLLRAKQALSQLSYSPKKHRCPLYPVGYSTTTFIKWSPAQAASLF